MQIQKSFSPKVNNEGALYIIPTPIGHLDDMTFRAVECLKEVQWIAAEDTRRTKKLLNHFSIKTPLISYHAHNEKERVPLLLEHLKKGEDLALVSDAGMPAISDPGQEIIQAALQENFSVIVLPGSNAALCALVGSGLPTKEFLFYGFLPRRLKEKQEELKRLKPNEATLIFYESPYRVQETLKLLQEELGDRNIALARELTKRFETYIRGKISEVRLSLDEQELKGEFSIVVEGLAQAKEENNSLWWSYMSVQEHVQYHMEENKLSSKAAIKKVAKEREMSRRDVYQLYHIR